MWKMAGRQPAHASRPLAPIARRLRRVLLSFWIAAALFANWSPLTASRQNSVAAEVPSEGGARLAGPGRPIPQIILRVGIEFRPPTETALFEALLAKASDLDRIAVAVEGAESSHGADPLMWRPEPDGPQGPMQVSRAAAADVGGGNRWDPSENRALGRAYLARLHQRFGNWRDAVMAYNWGPGSLDLWIKTGRPADKLVPAVAAYRDRVLRDTGFEIDAADGISLTMAGVPLRQQPVDPLRQAELQEEKIRNARLRQAYHANSEAIRRLQGFLDAAGKPEPGSFAAEHAAAWLDTAGINAEPGARADPTAARLIERAGAELLFAILHRVAGRPGYEVFTTLAKATPSTNLKLEACRQIAAVLVAKLRSENALILVLDASRREAVPAKPQ